MRPRHVWLLAIGFIAWSAAFVALYGLQALGCHFGWHRVALGPTDLHRALLVLGLVLTVGAHALIAWLVRPDGTAGFLHRTGYWASLAALGAAVLTFAPILYVSTCL